MLQGFKNVNKSDGNLARLSRKKAVSVKTHISVLAEQPTLHKIGRVALFDGSATNGATLSSYNIVHRGAPGFTGSADVC